MATTENSPAKGLPEGFELVPDELRAKYIVFAIEQISMVLTTLTHIHMQLDRPVRAVDPGNRGGCVAGLERASAYIMGMRRIPGYIKPTAAPSKPEAVALPEGEAVISGATAIVKLEDNKNV